MKNVRIILIVLSLVIISCNSKTETFKGDLYFKLINVISNKGMTKDEEVKFIKLTDSLGKNNLLSDEDKVIFEEIKKLKKLDLLTKPSIILKNNEELRTIYLTPDEYKKVALYQFGDLQKRKKKVKIELNSKELDSGIYFSDKIITIKEVDGTTPWKK